MIKDFPLFPEAASSIAKDTDLLFWAMTAICGAVAVGVFAFIIYFGVKYRRRHPDEHVLDYDEPKWLEFTWIIIPTIIFMGMFIAGARLYFKISRPPDNSLDVYVTAKQWMWKFQHLGGQSQINELTVPVGQPVKLIMVSEDVIHDFFVPEFRVHTDVLPARNTTAWFEATKTGRYRIFCSEYCGTDHSKMGGYVTVLEQNEFQRWLSGGVSEQPPAVQGKAVFEKYACNTCHMESDQGRGPSLVGLFGKPRQLSNGTIVRADENYIRESIVNSGVKIVAGYQPVMPVYQGQLDEQQLFQLLAYIKTQTPSPAAAPPEDRARPRAPLTSDPDPQSDSPTTTPSPTSNAAPATNTSAAAGTE